MFISAGANLHEVNLPRATRRIGQAPRWHTYCSYWKNLCILSFKSFQIPVFVLQVGAWQVANQLQQNSTNPSTPTVFRFIFVWGFLTCCCQISVWVMSQTLSLSLTERKRGGGGGSAVVLVTKIKATSQQSASSNSRKAGTSQPCLSKFTPHTDFFKRSDQMLLVIMQLLHVLKAQYIVDLGNRLILLLYED